MKIKVEVTQEDINNGVRQAVNNCPIACALKRLVQNPEVEDDVEFDFDGIRYQAELTSEALKFIEDFDKQGLIAVHPFSFEIDADEKYYEEEYSDYD